ncbi:MAG: winged helix DNA-binding domain-containing protein [Actinomycetota bacterium]
MAGRARTLARRELNRALLARQLFLERARIAVPRALEQLAGLQAQYAPSMYVGLWSRVAGFRRNDLTRALEQRSVAQGTLMRATIHLVSARDYWPFAVAIREARRRWWLRVQRGEPPEEELSAAARVRARLADGPLRRHELDALAGTARASGVGLWLDLLRVPPSGTWEPRRADVYALAEGWLGPPRIEPPAALDHLVRRYLGAFGPATRDDIADWAGMPAGDILPALGRLRLRRLSTEDGRELLDVPGAALPDPNTPAPLRFLPPWDATLLVHARRTGILSEEHRPLVFNTKTPHSVGTFLVDGSVAGTWSYRDGRVIAEPFSRLPRTPVRELREEADRLAAFHG